jgi:hypothetical protein
MKECDKGISHINSELHMIYIYSNNGRHSVTKNFTTLHYISPNYTSLNLSTLHFLSFKLNIIHGHALVVIKTIEALKYCRWMCEYSGLHEIEACEFTIFHRAL